MPALRAAASSGAPLQDMDDGKRRVVAKGGDLRLGLIGGAIVDDDQLGFRGHSGEIERGDRLQRATERGGAIARADDDRHRGQGSTRDGR